MNLSQWISSIFQLQRPMSSHQHLNESKPLQTSQLSSQVELTRARNVGSDGLNDLFQERITKLGGKENILLVGEAGYSLEDDTGTSTILEELSSALFQSPKKDNSWKTSKNSINGPKTSQTCITSQSPSKSRMLEFPIILMVFRVRHIMDSTNATKEILKDIQLRTGEFGSAIVGMVYSWEGFIHEDKVASKEQLRNLMDQVFKEQPWGVCCYNRSEPKSIMEKDISSKKRTSLSSKDHFENWLPSWEVKRDFSSLGASVHQAVILKGLGFSRKLPKPSLMMTIVKWTPMKKRTTQ
ncbi:hypothetical protein GDO78_014775 [Eleutherodactylus coqui]|uniref:Uncharacterized protein n=1 Tax=Eleutherodactylus coqui TaxID=57060 RepID=A0A8J6ELC4_ELECQ|nr:hypothetical protein GDO78_014775 [Eleutherodactylus coqui]